MIGQLYTIKPSEAKGLYYSDYIEAVLKYGVIFKEIKQYTQDRILVDYIFKSEQDKQAFMNKVYFGVKNDPMVISTLEPYQQKIEKQLTVGDLV